MKKRERGERNRHKIERKIGTERMSHECQVDFNFVDFEGFRMYTSFNIWYDLPIRYL